MMSVRIRLISIVLGLMVLGVVAFLVRRRRLDNFYAITWFLCSLVLILMGVFPTFVDQLAIALGIYFTPAAILVAAIGAIMLILLHLSIIVTDQHKQIRNFEKEIALLKRKTPPLC